MINRQPALTMDKVFLEKLNETIRANMSQPAFGADDLAQLMGMSHSSLLRKVQAITGKSINQLIREARLNEAWQMIHQEGVTASEVAFRVGFSTPAYFNTSFHRFFGYPPGDVKKKTGDHGRNDKEVRKEIPERIAHGTMKRNMRILAIALAFLLVVAGADVFFIFYGRGNDQISIAVLPFRNLNQDTIHQPFIEGIREQLLNDLNKISSFTVRSRVSSDRYGNTTKLVPEIGKELGANYIIEGSVGVEGDSVKIWIQLIHARADKHILSNQYTRKLKDLFNLQVEITRDICNQLNTVLSPRVKKQIEEVVDF